MNFYLLFYISIAHILWNPTIAIDMAFLNQLQDKVNWEEPVASLPSSQTSLSTLCLFWTVNLSGRNGGERGRLIIIPFPKQSAAFCAQVRELHPSLWPLRGWGMGRTDTTVHNLWAWIFCYCLGSQVCRPHWRSATLLWESEGHYCQSSALLEWRNSSPGQGGETGTDCSTWQQPSGHCQASGGYVHFFRGALKEG